MSDKLEPTVPHFCLNYGHQNLPLAFSAAVVMQDYSVLQVWSEVVVV